MRTFKQLVLGLSLLLVVTLAAACSPSDTVDMQQLYPAEVSGVDGRGNVYLVFNSGYYDEVFGEAEDDHTSSSDKLKRLADIFMFLDRMNYDIESEGDNPNGHLENGDTVTVSFEVDEEKAKELGLKLKNLDYEVKIEDLEKMKIFDPFKDATITFSGFDTMGEASFESSTLPVQVSSTYELSRRTDLANGDKVKVTLSIDEDAVERQGYIIDPLSKEYVVSGLEEIKVVNPFDHTEIIFEGYDGIGTARYTTFDYDYSGDVEFVLSQDANLRNGDTVELTFLHDPHESKTRGIRFKPERQSYTVEGLETPEMIERETLEAGYALEFVGAIPNLDVTVTNQLPAELKPHISYELASLDSHYGGSVDVKVVLNEGPEGLLAAGYTLPEEEMTFTTELTKDIVSIYATELEQLTSDTREAIYQQLYDDAFGKANANDLYSANSYWRWKPETIEDAEAIYFLSVKPGMEDTISGGVYNYLYVFFPLRGTSEPLGNNDTYSIKDEYVTSYIPNVILEPDGSNSFSLKNGTTVRKTDFLKDCVSEHINAKAGPYNITKFSLEEFLGDH